MTNIAFLFLSALGFLDASFLTNQHYTKDPFVCPLFGGCETVTSSVYSEIAGVPVALLGVIFYALIFLLSLASYFSNNKKLLIYAAQFSLAGLLTSLVLVYLQLYVIQAICFYCTMSAVSSTLLFLIGVKYLRKQKKYFLKKYYDYVFSISIKKWLYLALRISLGFIFFWAFLERFPSWINGSSPTLGFLANGTSGVFAETFQAMAGVPIIDLLYMFGMFSVGVALILGIYMRLAAIGGTMMMLLIYFSALPPTHNPLIDEHIIYILALWVLYVVDFAPDGRRELKQERKKKEKQRTKKARRG